ncbi:phosphoglycerol geranylgeranyltransferase [Halobacterium salinarum]|uniref:Geranylgeranylglyceryl phosphate synthase n=1 Tax=Halobacterium salinarum (strain ATCC 33171 / DSM 3754 / JCM 8978 / NBRC 102687 / NCIMB 764 / 91-R6) TaxID=2597657 RepID=A0A4D6GR22_HALS9|nr:putative phosphoglycerol geranylgeranyltransferase [Halobacterium salinarum]QCC44124.1 (S)-3-O-geranylgeranylglyceryl phosphate synthase 1 [Halobacterium salinarum]TYO76828.1 geranylgeranylglyceryl diphosphate synthase [Halobacterium salinarum DSM 3754]
MTAPWADWDHVLKIDPDKSLVDGETFDDIAQTGTDAIEIGGTLDVTTEKMRRVIDACRTHEVPLYQEPSNPAVVVEDEALDGYLVPVVLNAGDPFWITGAHKEWVRIADLDWERTTTEAYIVMNPDASVAEYTGADCGLDADEVGAYATVAERLLGQEVVYVEYSGTLGDPAVVEAAAGGVDDAAVFYGGGIDGYDAAYRMGAHADTIVVGDLVHEAGVDAVRETVPGVRDAQAEE